MKHTLTIIALIISTIAAWAQEFEQDGICYNITSTENLTAEVTRRTGNPYSGQIVIPEQVTYQSRSLSVTRIGNSAFERCTGLTDIKLPQTLTTIGYDAFSGCTALTTITIPGTVSSIKERAFCECTSLKNIIFPSPSPCPLPQSAFSKMQYLSTLHVPSGCKEIFQATTCWNLFAEIEDATLPEPFVPAAKPEPTNKKERAQYRAEYKRQTFAKVTQLDTPRSIAKKYYTSMSKLRKYNKITGPYFRDQQIVRLR